jgi:hypothetical protein
MDNGIVTAATDKQARELFERESLRQSLAAGSLHLRGVAASLRRLVEVSDDGTGPAAVDDAAILRLLAHTVELEADAMSEAEAFLNGQRKAVA